MFTSKGKLYEIDNKQCILNIRYRLLGGESTKLWGELIPVEYKCISDGRDYIVKLENNRKIKCYLAKKFHRMGAGFSSPFVYRFTATSPLTRN